MFKNRTQAGRSLAALLLERSVHWNDAIVMGVPRGGVVVAAEVASALGLPLDVVIASKIGAPQNPEFAVGAVAPDGSVSPNLLAGYSMEELRVFAAPAHLKVDARLKAFRAGGKCPDVEGRTVVLVDDGMATGLT
ncbi:MAG: phosphoribosyltransferase family protein, partial [Actinomycetota bacterium]|nr:phosphoribosyltransferase family protein [Actinomycetota bacterium]